jgi:hypothetical protein
VVSAASGTRAVGTASTDTTAHDIDPELLRVIRRVAHREFLLPEGSTRTSSLTRPVRRRPLTVSRAQRATRGTTARKVTWSR